MYLLNVFRVKHPKTPNGAPAVFLQHGLFGSADNFVMNDKMSPAFILARAGYDVWVGNSRGSRFSRGHLDYDANTDQDFWRFSIDTMAFNDLPAVTDYIREKTGQDKISFFAHSQGSAQMIMAFASSPEFWAERINLMVAVPPVIVSDDQSAVVTGGQRFYATLESSLA
jgi:pimeloyl-ACP methyl ester carboxylesterase